MRRDLQSGYALLAVLVVMVLAATFAVAIVGAVHALLLVGAADEDAGRASLVDSAAVAEVLGRLRWEPQRLTGALTGVDAGMRGQWSAEWDVALPPAASSWPRRRVRVAAQASRSHRNVSATVEVRAEDWAIGVSCEHDADIAAPFTVTGSGLYLGGCLRGREHVVFGVGDAGVTADGRPLDGARGGQCPVAAAHACAGIFAGGAEIHDPPATAFTDDGDLHTGAAALAAWVTGPSPEMLAAAEGNGVPAGDALRDGSLHLDAIGPADPLQSIFGRCIVLPKLDEVTIEGVARESAGPLLILVSGDAIIGQPGEPVSLQGGLVVCGQLRVRSEFVLRGSLHAGSLAVDSPASVTVPGDWRDRPLPGAARPVVVELDT
jgi:hypothetical protein